MRHEYQTEELLKKYPDYLTGVRKITKMIEQNRLIPVVSSGTNGKNPPLYRRYRSPSAAKAERPDQSEWLSQFPLCFDPDYYEHHPAQLEKDWPGIEKLIAFLERDPDLSVPASLNERSFQIFRQEKYLDQTGKRILKNLKYDAGLLNMYETYEPITSFYSSIAPSFILVHENLDPFVTCRRILAARHADGILVYGAGKKIWRNFIDVTETDIPWMKQSLSSLYYFGDLDWEGIRIYEELVQKYPLANIQLCVPAYQMMLAHAQKQSFEQMPKTKEGQIPMPGDHFFSFFTSEEKEVMQILLQSGRYIPQEILQAEDYEDLMERLRHEC